LVIQQNNFQKNLSENHLKPFEELTLFSKRVANIGRLPHSPQKMCPRVMHIGGKAGRMREKS
jgi:hypothetical protein